MRTEIVLISGKMGSGKTTLANELNNRASHRWVVNQLIFAGPIYELHDLILARMMGWKIPIPTSKKDRKLLQLLGTDWGRASYGDNVWVDIMRNEIQERIENDFTEVGPHIQALFVISDCRFRNEFDAFPDALRVRLSCKEDVRKSRAESWTDTKTHASEMDLDEYASAGKFDLYIDTKSVGVQGMTELVLAQLDKGSWREKRK